MADQSTYPYEPDQFDREADQVGAHGAHRAEEPFFKRNLSTIIVIVAALLALALVLWAVSGLGKGSEDAPAPAESSASTPADSGDGKPAASDNGGEAATEEPSEEAAPEVNREAPVLVLNGKRKQGMAGRWQKALEEQGWTKVDTDTGKRTKNAGVYYKNDEDKATAEALAKYVGVEAEKSDKYRANITVVIVEEPGDLAEIDGAEQGGDGE
ncbi:LytR C-terminal domain-containing protein [Dermabacter hominis]|uniref:LytR C-terminal domain-containing protein n=1 Tax=Dermabacter hominis TaxID=36740 RepID=UPI0021A700AE|nr:LytR C-terminal domain-containing protein [Dermabacter hominis]MCT1806402.1 LytR C-terminal domain-containing protein [Dermabacter hominis]MCT1955963.1 LytR C-terminal domain-containing protein [Dermabacter hominis]MDU4692082.1 LytR C-terminal domain-containing protein [Dermabacter sp.]